MSAPSLHFEEAGQGPALVLLHGFPFDHMIWADQLAGLAGVAHVLAPDLPGFGTSPPLPGAPEDATMDAYARTVLAWADGQRLARFLLAGHSMGGYLAFALARLAPERLAGLILVDTRPGPDSAEGRARRYRLAAAVATEGAAAVVGAMLPTLLAPGDRQPGVTARLRAVMLRQPPEAIRAALFAMAARPNSTPLLATLALPVLLISGADDVTVPPAESEAMRDRLRAGAYVAIPDAGHLPMLEAPDALNAAIRPWLAGLAES